MLTLDNLAHRYHCLPSEALARATTLDLYILDLSAKWEAHQHKLAQDPNYKPTPKLSQEQMLAMLERARNKKNETIRKANQ